MVVRFSAAQLAHAQDDHLSGAIFVRVPGYAVSDDQFLVLVLIDTFQANLSDVGQECRCGSDVLFA